MKKIGSLLKFFIVGSLWSCGFVAAWRRLLQAFWTFDPFSKTSWRMIAEFWNDGGVISSGKDYLLFAVLLVGTLIWLWGMRFFYRVSYVNLLLSPFKYFDNRNLKKYAEQTSHVVIKNIAIGEKMTAEDVIQQRLKKLEKQEKADTAHTSEVIRSGIAHKITERKDQE
jgi:hypothetical protein